MRRKMFEAEWEALRATFKLVRPTWRETFIVAGVYAVQAVLCVVLLRWLYVYEHWNAVVWALLAAILALQPGLSQSVVTSVIRILANTVGAGVALAVSRIPIASEAQLIVALIIVIFTCELARLDQALRTACAATVVVLTVNGGHVWTTGSERFTATLLGCGCALLVQLVSDMFLNKLLGPRPVIVPQKS